MSEYWTSSTTFFRFRSIHIFIFAAVRVLFCFFFLVFLLFVFARRRNVACRSTVNKAETESGANKVNPAKVGMPSVNYSYTKISQSRFFWNLRKRRFSTGSGRPWQWTSIVKTFRREYSLEQNGVAYFEVKTELDSAEFILLIMAFFQWTANIARIVSTERKRGRERIQCKNKNKNKDFCFAL